MHPRCHHGVSTYYEGINDEPEEVTKAKHNHNEEDKYTQYLQQRQKQYERLAVGSLLPENILLVGRKSDADKLINDGFATYYEVIEVLSGVDIDNFYNSQIARG